MTNPSGRARRTPLPMGLLGAGLGGLAILSIAAVAYAADLLVVIQEQASIRKEQRLLSPAVAKVKEGDQVTKLGEEGSWYQVEFLGAEGWIPKSAVSSDLKIELSGKTVADGGVRTTEQGAAARPFSPEVEKEFKAQRTDLNEAYKIVDRVQGLKWPDEQIVRFLKDGRLGGEAVADAAPAQAPAAEAASAAPSRAVAGKDGRATPPWKR